MSFKRREKKKETKILIVPQSGVGHKTRFPRGYPRSLIDANEPRQDGKEKKKEETHLVSREVLRGRARVNHRPRKERRSYLAAIERASKRAMNKGTLIARSTVRKGEVPAPH